MGSFTDFSGRTTVVNARIEYTGTYINNNTVSVTLKLYAARTDWDGASNATYSASTLSPSSWTEDYSMPQPGVFRDYSEVHLLTRTFTVSVDSNGVASVNMSFSVTATSSSSYTVSANVTSLSFGAPPYSSYKVYISASDGVNITVTRTSSPKAGAYTGKLFFGDTIYDGDVLSISYSANDGYYITDATVNGSMFGTGNTITVSGPVDISVAASLYYWYLYITTSEGITVKVERTSSEANASIGELKEGDFVYYSDVLKITYSVASGYELKTHTINGIGFSSGDTYTVTSGVDIIVSAGALGLVYIAGVAYQACIGNGSSWGMYAPHVGEGTDKGFVLCS